jgi:ornithine carbamoyltransferase
MSSTVPHRHLWSPERLTSADLLALLTTAAMLKHPRRRDDGWGPLRGRHVALLCSSSSDVAPTFQRAVVELGGTASLLNADEWRVRAGDRIPEAARLLGRLYDAIDCCDLPAGVVEQIEAHCGVPVFNGLAKSDHPLALLGELLTMQETADKPLNQSRLRLAASQADHGAPAGLELALLAGVQIVPSPAPAPASASPAASAGTETDFILDTSAPSAGQRLLKTHASVEQQAEINGRLAANRQRALQAALVCGLQ